MAKDSEDKKMTKDEWEEETRRKRGSTRGDPIVQLVED